MSNSFFGDHHTGSGMHDVASAVNQPFSSGSEPDREAMRRVKAVVKCSGFESRNDDIVEDMAVYRRQYPRHPLYFRKKWMIANQLVDVGRKGAEISGGRG